MFIVTLYQPESTKFNQYRFEHAVDAWKFHLLAKNHSKFNIRFISENVL